MIRYGVSVVPGEAVGGAGSVFIVEFGVGGVVGTSARLSMSLSGVRNSHVPSGSHVHAYLSGKQ